ncbi:MAG: hypothetical protein ACPGOV_13490 [Magnetovibrionaceae bacterium]
MRAYELYETNLIAQGVYDPSQDTIGQLELRSLRKATITLRDVRRLNKIKKARRKAQKQKLALVSAMYSEDQLGNDGDLERARLEYEKEVAQLELEKQRLAIQREIDDAEIDLKQREKISKMAMRSLSRKS